MSWRNSAVFMETVLRSSVVEPVSLPALMVISGVSLVPVTVTTTVAGAVVWTSRVVSRLHPVGELEGFVFSEEVKGGVAVGTRGEGPGDL